VTAETAPNTSEQDKARFLASRDEALRMLKEALMTDVMNDEPINTNADLLLMENIDAIQKDLGELPIVVVVHVLRNIYRTAFHMALNIVKTSQGSVGIREFITVLKKENERCLKTPKGADAEQGSDENEEDEEDCKAAPDKGKGGSGEPEPDGECPQQKASGRSGKRSKGKKADKCPPQMYA
jgi:hypothetical protein